MNNLEKFELAKNYFTSEVTRLISFLYYHNRYSYTIYDSSSIVDENISLAKKIDQVDTRYVKELEVGFEHLPCFGKFLSGVYKLPTPQHRYRFVWQPYIKPYTPECANFTWMNKDLLEEHVNYPKTLLGLDYDVAVYDALEDDSPNSWGKHWEVIFDFKKLNVVEIKFVLFWSRYAAEFPSNLALLDAILLKDKYPNEELYNLVIMASYLQHHHLTCQGINENQCLSIYGRFISKERLYKGLQEEKNILDIFKRTGASTRSDSVFYEPDFALFNQKAHLEIPRLSFMNGRDTESPRNCKYNLDLKRFFTKEEIDCRMKLYVEMLYPHYDKERII